MSANDSTRGVNRFGVGDLLGGLVLLAVAYAGLGRLLHTSGHIPESAYNVGLVIVLLVLAIILVAMVVIFR